MISTDVLVVGGDTGGVAADPNEPPMRQPHRAAIATTLVKNRIQQLRS